MKLRIFTILATCIVIAGCAGGKSISKINYSPNFNADNVNRVAIIDFSKSPGTIDSKVSYDSTNITDKFTAELVGSEIFTLLDRSDIDKIMREVGFQTKSTGIGMLDDRTVERLQALGADSILTGKLISFKELNTGNFIIYSEVHLTAKLLKIETGEVLWSAELMRRSRGKLGKDEAEPAEFILSDIIADMSVTLKTESKFKRFMKW